jgi:hypothetical protein
MWLGTWTGTVALPTFSSTAITAKATCGPNHIKNQSERGATKSLCCDWAKWLSAESWKGVA